MNDDKDLQGFRLDKAEEDIGDHERRIKELELTKIETKHELATIQRDVLKQQNMTLEMEKSIKESNEKMQTTIQKSNEKLIENVVESVVKIIEVQKERDNERDKNKVELSKSKIAIIVASISGVCTVIATLLSKLIK